MSKQNCTRRASTRDGCINSTNAATVLSLNSNPPCLLGEFDHLGQALGGVGVLQLVEDGLALDLGVHRPLLQGLGGDAGGQRAGAEGVLCIGMGRGKGYPCGG